MRAVLIAVFVTLTGAFGALAISGSSAADTLGIAYIAVVVSLHLAIDVLCRIERHRD